MSERPRRGSSRSKSSKSHNASQSSRAALGRKTSSDAGFLQRVKLEILSRKLKNLRYCSTTRDFLSHFGPLPSPVKYQDILRDLAPDTLLKPRSAAHRLTYIDGNETRDWPKSTNETDHYTPLACLLANIQEKLKERHPDLHSLHFSEYDRVMADGVHGSDPLKPDALGTFEAEVSKVAWKDVAVAIEVKGDDYKLWPQAASYAEAMFASRPGCIYAVVITFNPQDTKIRFSVHSRCGISSSLPLDISKIGGFRSFVRVMAHMLVSGRNAQDLSQDSRFILLPGYLTKVLAVIHTNTSLTGRATRVVRGLVEQKIEDLCQGVKVTDIKHDISSTVTPPQNRPIRTLQQVSMSNSPSLGSIPEQAEDPTGPGAQNAEKVPSTATNINIETSIESTTLALGRLNVTDENVPQQNSFPPSSSSLRNENEDPTAFLPHKLQRYRLFHTDAFPERVVIEEKVVIIKDSWPLEEKAGLEAAALAQCQGMWGVPKLLAAHRVLGIDNKEEIFVPHGATLEEGRDHSMDHREAEEESVDVKTSELLSATGTSGAYTSTTNQLPRRHHRRLVLATDGESLHDAKSPAELLEAVIHALIGRWSYFKAGWLHRDVSVGNVLLVSSGEHRDPPKEFMHELDDSTLCKGFLIDMDLALQRGDHVHEREKSGTLPFISRRLLQAWAAKRSSIHAACDDVESLAWVLLWVPIVKAQTDKKATDIEEAWLENLDCNGDERNRLYRKVGIIEEMVNEGGREAQTNYTAPFLELLHTWFQRCKMRAQAVDARKEVQSKEEEDEIEKKELYLPIIQAAVQMLKDNATQLQQWSDGEGEKGRAAPSE